MSYLHSTRTGVQKESSVDGTAVKYCQILLSIQPARPDLEMSTFIGRGLSTHVYKPKRPFTKCERQFSFWHTLRLQRMAHFQNAPFNPQSCHCSSLNPGTMKRHSQDPGNGSNWNCDGKILQMACDSPLN